jgi:hypothetical protein
MIKVTFDRNVWTKICSSGAADDLAIASLRKAIRAGDVEGFIPEVAFTLEGIDNIARKAFFSDYEAKTECTVNTAARAGKIHMGFCIGPNPDLYPRANPIFDQELKEIEKWAFKLLRCVRVANIKNSRVDESLFARPAIDERLETIYRFAECAQAIEDLGGGLFGNSALRTLQPVNRRKLELQ